MSDIFQLENEFRNAWLKQVYNDSYQRITTDADGNPILVYTNFGENMNIIQWELECCGVNGGQDYQASIEWPQDDVCIIGS